MYTEQHHPTTQKVEGTWVDRHAAIIYIRISEFSVVLVIQHWSVSRAPRPSPGGSAVIEWVCSDGSRRPVSASFYHWMKQGRGRANERVETKSAISSHNIAEISNDNDTILYLAHCTYTYCLAEIKSFHNPAILSPRLLPNSLFQLTVTIIPLHLPSLKPLHSVILNLSYLTLSDLFLLQVLQSLYTEHTEGALSLRHLWTPLLDIDLLCEVHCPMVEGTIPHLGITGAW